MNQKCLSILFVTMSLFGLFLTACRAVDVPDAEPIVSAGTVRQEMSVVERLHFHDRLWENQAVVEVSSRVALDGVSIANRIRFQDQRDQSMTNATSPATERGMSMADRIRFQDRLWERPYVTAEK
jgi:hypothetical protein